MSDLYERISSSRNRWYSWLEAFLNVYTCYLKARFIACKKTRCVHIYPSTRTSCKITLHFFTLADEGFTVFTVANARCAVYHAIPVLSILLFGPAVIYPAVAWNGRPRGGDGVYFRLHVSNPVLSRFFFRLPRVNRAKTQDLSLSSSRSTPFLPPPTLSRFNFFLSFHAIASFVLFFFFRCLDEPPAYSGICISSRVSVVLPAFLSPPQTLLFHHHLTVCICIRVRIPPSLSRAFLA